MKTTENTTPTPEIRKETRPGSGGYRGLRTFQLATIIYDATVAFCSRCVDDGARTHERMVQAARSGRHNIAAGGRAVEAGGTAAAGALTEARNCFDELLLDYEDFLRQRTMRMWPADDCQTQAVRDVVRESDSSSPLQSPAYAAWLEHNDPAVVANALVCLLRQVDYLLARQAAALERDPAGQHGGSRPMAAARSAERQGMKHHAEPSPFRDSNDAPACKLCGKPMALRTARTGKNEGRSFWGCTGYPECKGTVPGKKTA